MKENRALSGGLCALGCEVLYGLSYLFTKRTADAASALALLGWRFIVALAVMSLCVALGLVKIRLRGRRLWPLLRVALFCPCLYFIGETVGIRETTVTESGVFLACVPALSLLASAVILKKKPTRRQIPCPECEAEIDYEIGPDESMEDALDTAELLEKIIGEEEVEKMDGLLSLAITGGDCNWI